jgi:hypothetical protein
MYVRVVGGARDWTQHTGIAGLRGWDAASLSTPSDACELFFLSAREPRAPGQPLVSVRAALDICGPRKWPQPGGLVAPPELSGHSPGPKHAGHDTNRQHAPPARLTSTPPQPGPHAMPFAAWPQLACMLGPVASSETVTTCLGP